MSAGLRAGYKQTDVGVIPADWAQLTVGELIEFQGGSQPEKSVFSATPRPGFVRLIQIRDYKSDKFEVFAPTALLRRFCDANDIMIGRYGPPVFQILRGLTGAYNVALIKACPLPEVDRDFAYFFLKQDSLFEFIDKLSRRSSGQTGVDLSELRRYPLPLPPLPEQRAIATALSDVDALLGGLDSLIAKKQGLKEAAMQQLLTGQTRLPGFSGEWEVKRLGDLFKFSGGYSASRDQLTVEGHCYLHYGDIHGSSKTTIDTKADYQDIPKLDIPLKQVSPGSLLADGDVVFVDASEDDAGTSKHVVVVNKGGLPFISGLHTIVAKAKTAEFAHEYLEYCFQTPAIREQFMFYAVGTKVSGISKSNILKLTVPVPSVPEQTAIAAILSDMDTELASLQARRSKTQALKQAMMQELLTGRIRLVETGI
jgi:type I restriction enzyme, S subunit